VVVRGRFGLLVVGLIGSVTSGCVPKADGPSSARSTEASPRSESPGRDGLPTAPAKPDISKALLGTWSNRVSDRQVDITITSGQKGRLDYLIKRGLPGFSDGYFEETGFAEVGKERITWVPSALTDHPKNGSRAETNRYREWRKAMDEGAWKPFPPYISSIDASRLVLKDHLGNEKTYRRLH